MDHSLIFHSFLLGIPCRMNLLGYSVVLISLSCSLGESQQSTGFANRP
jgi:hypothetical protein